MKPGKIRDCFMSQLHNKQALPSPALLPRQVRLDLALGFLLAQQVFFSVREVAEPLQEDFPWGWWLGCQGRAAGGGIELVL